MTNCPSCGAERLSRFCPECGEERVDDQGLRLKAFLTSELDDAPVTRAVTRTFYTLFRYPGRLTSEYMVGRRKPYVRPFRVYLLISVVFFLILPHTWLFNYQLRFYQTLPFFGNTPSQMVESELKRAGLTHEEYEKRFNKTLETQKKTMMLAMVPLLALGLWALFPRRPIALNIVFAVHYLAVLLFYMVVVVVAFKLFYSGLHLLYRVLPNVAEFLGIMWSGEAGLTMVIFTPMFFYVRRAMRQAYQVSMFRAGWAAAGMLFWQMVLIVFFYRVSLFFTTYWTIHFFGV